MQKPGVLTVISGFSGAGKGTVVKRLLETKENYSLSVSATTRAPRNGEVEGESYYFLSKPVFEQMIEKDELLEWATYVNNYYGTPKKYVFEQLEAGKNIILEIELQGAMKVRKQYPGAVMIFIVPPSIKELKDRLVGRGTESMDVIIKRLKRAEEETAYIKDYDYIVENDVLEACAEIVHSIVVAEQHHAAHYGGIEQVLESQFNEVLKGE
ncbi:guanylate kinase [Petrocella atlantisensis]|uniref:Guanylate kinase n=1 Tax=Petrocella atlantisensis TaxID=2173034 RepID=A0A3P7NX11_9FIRM|nr:guanylate kinase [Petrocella atlantisensis]MCF8018227.1 guanylate kinase [Vallitaleaceae bacterium]PKM55218.1 MAG: guanylate kinase [Firmicutes bacterium HGW-Firmicutes-5]VDN45860.1 guanylate kinase [Petrocella atlantisensis]